MSNKQKILIVLTAVIMIVVISLMISGQKKINDLNSQVDDLETELNEKKSKILELEDEISGLEDENSELKDKLSNVKYFDNGGIIGRGYSESGINFTGQVMETEIDGDFEGWDGETIFKMMNGSIWQQSSYAYTYHYAYMPKVIIYRKGGAYYMKVEGVDDEIQVRQLK